MMFWLGIHHANWLSKVNVPTMVSHRVLAGRKTLPRASAPWFKDSSGFTELGLHGRYETSARDYAAETKRQDQEIGALAHAAIQDWMCEPKMVQKTGLTIAEHQQRTITSWFDLNELEPDLPWLPVLQGWAPDDYLRHIGMWQAAGVDLFSLPLVGLGTVCKRQDTVPAARLVGMLSRTGLKLHGFGFKITGIVRAGSWLASGDSMAWSLRARYPDGGRCASVRNHKNCANCLPYALKWRNALMDRLSQLQLWENY